MIKKPADAVPHTAHLFTDTGNMVPVYVKAFTAAECAEIARAYAQSIATEAIATWMSESKHEIAREDLNAWRAKFAEWECK